MRMVGHLALCRRSQSHLSFLMNNIMWWVLFDVWALVVVVLADANLLRESWCIAISPKCLSIMNGKRHLQVLLLCL